MIICEFCESEIAVGQTGVASIEVTKDGVIIGIAYHNYCDEIHSSDKLRASGWRDMDGN